MYSVATTVGIYNLLLVKDAGNQVGVYYYWDGRAGNTSYTITADLRATFWPTDAPAGTGGGGTLPSVRANSRGALQATSSILPTAPPSGQISTVRWSITPGSGWGTLSGNAHILTEPFTRNGDNVIGWWFVSDVNGVEFEEVFCPLNYTVNFHLFVTGSQNVQFGVAPDGQWQTYCTRLSFITSWLTHPRLSGIGRSWNNWRWGNFNLGADYKSRG